MGSNSTDSESKTLEEQFSLNSPKSWDLRTINHETTENRDKIQNQKSEQPSLQRATSEHQVSGYNEPANSTEFCDESLTSSSEHTIHGQEPSSPALVTPPSSTVESAVEYRKQSQKWPNDSTTPISRPSFSSRRRGKPASLDIDALRQERQFTGPYSSNPLLSRKRAHGDISPTGPYKSTSQNNNSTTVLEPDASKTSTHDTYETLSATYEHEASPGKVRLPQMLSGPLAALTSYAFPDKQKLPVRSATSQTCLLPDSVTPTPTEQTRASSQPVYFPIYSANSYTRDDPSCSKKESLAFTKKEQLNNKRARFMELCGEIWDLLNEK